ncbi:MAG: hypothetical protein AAGI25_04230 [Bacteroidota bacterium]
MDKEKEDIIHAISEREIDEIHHYLSTLTFQEKGKIIYKNPLKNPPFG